MTRQWMLKRGFPMRIEVRNESGVMVLLPKGKITIGVGDVALREKIADALESGVLRILIDCCGITNIDSSGLVEMVSGYTTVANRGGRLKLIALPPKVKDILQITQLISVFEVFQEDQRKEALESFQ